MVAVVVEIVRVMDDDGLDGEMKTTVGKGVVTSPSDVGEENADTTTAPLNPLMLLNVMADVVVEFAGNVIACGTAVTLKSGTGWAAVQMFVLVISTENEPLALPNVPALNISDQVTPTTIPVAWSQAIPTDRVSTEHAE